MSEIVRREPDSLPEKMEWAKAMATASLLPRQYQQNPGNLLFAVEYADALDIPRINAITSIHVIDGKPSASAELIASMVRKAGHKLRIPLSTDTECIAQVIRADDPDFTYEARWTVEKAKAAGLWGRGNWSKYPGAMLRARAITEVARMGASEALLGVVYTPEELGADVDETGAVVHTVTRVEQVGDSGVERMRGFLGQQPAAASEPPPAEQAPAAAPTQAAAPADDVPGMTQAQSRKMGAAMRERGLGDRDQALAFVASVIGRTVGSRNELTKFEAARVIDALEKDGPVPAEVEVVEAEIVEEAPAATPQAAAPSTAEPNPNELWEQITKAGAAKGMSTGDLEDDFLNFAGFASNQASGHELAAYLKALTTGEVA